MGRGIILWPMCVNSKKVEARVFLALAIHPYWEFYFD
jgi:hypothetical protein